MMYLWDANHANNGNQLNHEILDHHGIVYNGTMADSELAQSDVSLFGRKIQISIHATVSSS